MFPYRDHNPSSRIPYVTYSLMAINIAIFLLTLNANEYELYSRFALVPAWVTHGEGYLGLLTSMFLHGGWMHIFGNMLFLWVFGDNVEDSFGHFWFLIFYLLSGFGADALHIALAPNSNTPMIGASGAIAGVLGAYWLLFPRARVDVLVILIIYIRSFAVPAFWVLLAWIAIQVFFGLTSSTTGGGVAYWAHFGGFVAGLLMTLPYWLGRGGIEYWKRIHYHPPHPASKTPEIGRLPVTRRRPR